jgi:putative phosphonate transport system ATP-binding protein
VKPLLRVEGLTKLYGQRVGCLDVDFEVFPGEALAVVGESGSGKTTLLQCVSGGMPATSGRAWFDCGDETVDLLSVSEARRRKLAREQLGFVRQNPRDGLRMRVTAGANIAEPLLAKNERRYSAVRAAALDWIERVEIGADRVDDLPSSFSGGMQQRLQIARNLVNHPRLVFMDEPTGGLDVSVQARLLDLLRRLVEELHVSVIVVTHDLGVARLLAERMLVMKDGRVVERGLTDQVLDDPQHPYTQLLTASILQP